MTFGICSLGYASDYEDSLFIESLVRLSRSEKQVIIDSLLSNNRRYARKIQRSKTFIEGCSREHYQKLWQMRFEAAYPSGKLQIIDSMLEEYDINFDLIENALLDNVYQRDFPTYGAFLYFRKELVLKLGKLYKYTKATKILSEYFNSGYKSRTLDRSALQPQGLSSGRMDMAIVDSNGVTWKVECLSYYPDTISNIWLAKKEPGSDDWEGPWFTGLYGKIPETELFANLGFFNDLPYLKCSGQDTYSLVSIEYLTKDKDKDGLYDIDELAFGTDPQDSDTDGDGLKDGIDLNPLARGVFYPNAKDRAVSAAVKLSAIHDDPVNIYILRGDINADMQYLTDSPNAMFLIDKDPAPSWQLREKSGGIPMIVTVFNEDATCMKVLIRTLIGIDKEEHDLYGFEKPLGKWIITCYGTECSIR
ncbi:MAG: hypothetical protein V3W18_01585 [candidate division Zixibacteria bacterium]